MPANRGFGFATPEKYGRMEKTGNKKYLMPHTKLVIVKNKKTKTETGFFMTLAGEKGYLEQNGFNLGGNHYKSPAKGFNGYVFFHNLDGSFSNGWKYTDGKVTHTTSLNFINLPVLQLKSASACQTTTIYYWETICTDHYYMAYYVVNGVTYTTGWKYNFTSCSSTLIYGGSITACSYIDEGSGESGSYTGNTIGYQPTSVIAPKPYSAKPGDKFAKQNMSQSMNSQVLNSCFISIMEYINKSFCSGNKDLNFYNNDYYATYNVWPIFAGVDTNKSFEFLSRHFKVYRALNYIFPIDAGHIIMTDLKTDDPTVTHAVAFIGYHPDNTLIYMDPMDGSLKEASTSYFNASYVYEIHYCKDLTE